MIVRTDENLNLTLYKRNKHTSTINRNTSTYINRNTEKIILSNKTKSTYIQKRISINYLFIIYFIVIEII